MPLESTAAPNVAPSVMAKIGSPPNSTLLSTKPPLVWVTLDVYPVTRLEAPAEVLSPMASAAFFTSMLPPPPPAPPTTLFPTKFASRTVSAAPVLTKNTPPKPAPPPEPAPPSV
ncbi:hypothetical protein ATO2_14595 [Roseovarius sp. 22II1-1F6A]|nr:hypothetical protein ATO2_14595 [Roseovarius sp. 22II1-1F6A]